MKNILFLLLLLAFAGNSDEKLIKQAGNSVAKGEYEKAVTTLSKVSEKAQTNSVYIQLYAQAYDSLKQYNNAIKYYSQQPGGPAIDARISYLKAEQAAFEEAERIRLEKMKNCKKCVGTGYLESQAVCTVCGGSRISVRECPRCKGDGQMNCSNCGGTGKIETDYNGRSVAANCGRCNGEGSQPCTALCNRGTVTEDCKKCNATGSITIRTVCQH